MAPGIVSDIELPRDIPESQLSAANVPIEKAFGLKNRTIIITGAGRGLGITLAVAVLESGADAICLDILPEPSAEEWDVITRLQKSTGVRATYHRCDITNEEAVEKVVAECGEEARQRGKPVKGMISCAGIQQMVDAIDYPMDGFRRIMEVNVAGSFLISKHTARLLRDQKLGGSIVMIASMSGQIANRVSQSPKSKFQSCNAFLTRPIGPPLLSVQHQQSRRTPNVPFSCIRMGTVGYQSQYALPWIYPYGHD